MPDDVVLDLAEALASFDALAKQKPAAEPADPVEELRAALTKVLERATTAAPRLEEEDTVSRARQAYVAALLRILDYMLFQPSGEQGLYRQANIALGFVRHIETSRLAALQIGRSVKDDRLANDVQALRARIQEMAESRSRVREEARARQRKALPSEASHAPQKVD